MILLSPLPHRFGMHPCGRALPGYSSDGIGLSVIEEAGSRPGGRGTFLCFAKAKYPKERRAGFVVPSLRYGHAALLGPGGVRVNSLRSNIRAPFSAQSCATRLLITAGESEYRIQQGRAMARPCLAVGLLAVRISRRVAGLSSAAAGGSGRALSERSEFSPTPPDASSARNRAAALTSARLLFGDFLLAKQEKVTALSGAHPDTPVRRGHRQRKEAHLEARPEAKEA